MFERYTEKARRVIFFARYEASQWGSPYLEPEHLLLALLREARPLLSTLLPPAILIEDLKEALEESLERGENLALSVDLPFSHTAKRILAYGAEEAERLASKHIAPEHLLLGILREGESTAAKVLMKYGSSVDDLRRTVALSEHADQGPLTAGQIATDLRSQFAWLVPRLTPEIEPAIVFSLEPRADQ